MISNHIQGRPLGATNMKQGSGGATPSGVQGQRPGGGLGGQRPRRKNGFFSWQIVKKSINLNHYVVLLYNPFICAFHIIIDYLLDTEQQQYQWLFIDIKLKITQIHHPEESKRWCKKYFKKIFKLKSPFWLINVFCICVIIGNFLFVCLFFKFCEGAFQNWKRKGILF